MLIDFRAPETIRVGLSPLPLVILSQIGLTLLMFQIGLEFDFSHLRERVDEASNHPGLAVPSCRRFSWLGGTQHPLNES